MKFASFVSDCSLESRPKFILNSIHRKISIDHTEKRPLPRRNQDSLSFRMQFAITTFLRGDIDERRIAKAGLRPGTTLDATLLSLAAVG